MRLPKIAMKKIPPLNLLLSGSFSLVLAIAISGCKAESKPAEIPLPNTPETVVRAWQEHLDKNQFADAKKLSTPEAIKNLETIEAILLEFEEEGATDTIHTEFLNLRCGENGESATCHYALDVDGEKILDSFVLRRIGGQWLVDWIEKPGASDSDLQELFEGLKGYETPLDSLNQ